MRFLFKQLPKAAVLFLFNFNFVVFGQGQGENDPTFNLYDSGYYYHGRGVESDIVYKVFTQPDGKVLVGGDITMVNSISRAGIARLNPDFSLDATFNPGTGAQGASQYKVLDLERLSDGRFYVGGSFQIYNGVSQMKLVRVYANGNLDPTFQPSSNGFTVATIYSLEIQPDSNLLVAGIFSQYDGNFRKGICRISSSGAIDPTFNTGPIGFVGSPRSIALQPDGKIIAGGNFTMYDVVARKNILRLNSDGTIDPTFNPGTGFNNIVNVVKLQADGKVLVGGEFTSFNGIPINGIARLNSDGSLDMTYNPGSGTEYVLDVAIQADGRILVGGAFQELNGYVSPGLVRLQTNGSVDSTFVTRTTNNSRVTSINVLPDDKIMIGGWFLYVNSDPRGKVARLNPNGSTDSTFNSGTGFTARVNSMALQNDQKIVAAGFFKAYNGKRRWGVARLHTDGQIDYGFSPEVGFSAEVLKVAIQADQKILAGGHFVSYDNTSCSKIARLHPDGSFDSTFIVGSGFNDYVSDFRIQANGKIVVVGNFTTYNGVTGINQVVRLNSDGSIDNSFTPPALPLLYSSEYLECVELQPDGKILIGGNFQGFNGNAALKYIVRLFSDGTIDPGFSYGSGFNNLVTSIEVGSNGRILLTGDFTTYNGNTCRFVTRLLENGGLDPSFSMTGTGIPQIARIAKNVSDNKILVGGYFTNYNGVSRNALARLNYDGTLDAVFDPGSGFSGDGNSVFVQDFVELPNDKIVVGGSFLKYDNIWRNAITRIYSGPCHSSSYISDTSCSTYTLNNISYEESGIYNQVIPNQNNCDSVITFELYITNEPPLPDLSNLPVLTGQCDFNVSILPTATDYCNGQIVATTEDTLYYDVPGTYVIAWQYMDLDSNISLQNQTLIIADIAPPIPDSTVLPAIVSSCFYEVTTFPTSTDNCGGLIVGTTNDPLVYATLGNYSVNWIFEDAAGNISTQTQNVLIYDSVPPSIQSCPADIISCENTPFYLTTLPTASDNCEVASFTSNYNAGEIFPTGVHIIEYEAIDNAGNSTVCAFEVIVNELEEIIFNSPDTMYLEYTPDLVLQATPSGGTFTGTNVSNSVFSPTFTGNYTITYSYLDSNGCVIVDSYIVHVLSALSIDQNAFSENKIAVFPNPAYGEINFSFPENYNELRINMYSIEGKLISTDLILEKVSGTNYKMDISKLSSALYLIEIDNSRGNHTIKLYKR